jgi:hypothetical protein
MTDAMAVAAQDHTLFNLGIHGGSGSTMPDDNAQAERLFPHVVKFQNTVIGILTNPTATIRFG